MAIQTGDKVKVVKGCRDRHIEKGTVATVTVTELGADWSHQVRVTLSIPTNVRVAGVPQHRTLSFYARHKNRLSDPIVSLNDGNPLHTIRIEKA